MIPSNIQVEIVYALPEHTLALALTLPLGATVADAVAEARNAGAFAQLNVHAAAVGIFGRLVGPGQPLKQGDRVEIYRPLAADPKTARRRRVANKSGRS